MQETGKFLLKNKVNGQDQISYQWFKAYEINYLDYSNIFSVTTFPWADKGVDEFNRIMKVGGTPGVLLKYWG